MPAAYAEITFLLNMEIMIQNGSFNQPRTVVIRGNNAAIGNWGGRWP